MTRGRRLFLGVMAAIIVFTPARVGDAQTATPATIGGLQGTAAASGLHMRYNPAGLLPVPPPVDLGIPDAYTTIASGPATFARASVADPGDLLYSPDALLLQAVPGYPGGIPAYPYRVSAASGSGSPTAEVTPAPGFNARARATTSGSLAEGSMPSTSAPGVASTGSQLARTTTATDGSTATVAAWSQVSNFDLLGLLTIDSIVTDLRATSRGGTTTILGGTRVTGAAFMGTPVIIDGEGIHQDPDADPMLGEVVPALAGGLNEVLNAAGIHVTLVSPVDLGTRTATQRTSTGVRIDMEFSPRTAPQLWALLDMLPPIDNPVPGLPLTVEDVIAAARAQHLTAIELGSAAVALTARPAAVFGRKAPTTPSDSARVGPTSFPSFIDASPAPAPFIDSETPAVAEPVPLGAPVPLPAGGGVGALLLLALLAAPFVGQLLAKVSLAVLAPRGVTSCLEDP